MLDQVSFATQPNTTLYALGAVIVDSQCCTCFLQAVYYFVLGECLEWWALDPKVLSSNPAWLLN